MNTSSNHSLLSLTRCALVLASAWISPSLHADQLPHPSVTASARAFNASFTAANLFDAADAEFASLGQGAVSTPFTTNVTNGTWVELDFGATVEFDRFVMRSRANAVDVVGQSRLIVSDDPTFDDSDRIFAFDPSGSNGAGLARNLYATIAGRYARWEVITRSGGGLNLGANQMWFLKTPAGHSALPPPSVINSSSPFNAGFAPANAVNGDFGSDYASLGAQASMFIDFDLGAEKQIAGFEFLNRFADRVTTFDLTFANSPEDLLGFPLAMLSFTANADGNFVNSATFEPVSARYVRLQATGFEGADNTGVREIQFFTLAGQPPAITQVPTGGTRFAGDAFAFSSAAVGDLPLTFQWFRSGVPVNGATNSSLFFTDLQASDSGDYEIVVTNLFGSATSAPPATLTVLDPPLDITTDLRLWLKFDDTFGPLAVDDSGNLRDGALSGFPGDDSQWVMGRIVGGIRVNPDGSAGDDVVLVPDDNGGLDFSGSLAFTLAAWVNAVPAQENGAAVLAKGTGAGGEQYALDIVNGAYRFFVRNESGGAAVFQTSVPANNTWQHLVAVFSVALNRLKVYVNGIEILTGTPPATLLQNTHEVSIGSRQASAGAYDLNLNGTLDDLRIYARALTPRDVLELYNQASLIPPSIVTPPAGGTILACDTATLMVAADGSAPLSYQWSKNGSPIAGATHATLQFNNVTTNDAGSYIVRISNAIGAVTSDPAIIMVDDPAPDLASGLVLHLKLDETSGTAAADSSGANHHGVLQDFPEEPWTAGIVGGALAFNPDGAAGDDVVLVTDDGGLDFSSSLEFTLAAWVNGEPAQEPGGPIICKGTGGGGEQFAIDVFNGFRFYGWTGATPPVYVLSAGIGPDNTWQHVVGVFSRPLNRLKFYINGVEAASGAPPDTVVQNNHEVSVGSRQLSSGAYDLNFIGSIDDVRVYNRAITPREVKALNELGAPPRLNITRSGDNVTISWPASVTGYTLESSDVLPATVWNAVNGVVDNSVTQSAGPGDTFFRLRKE